MKKEFPVIGYSELTKPLYNCLKDKYSYYGKSLKSYDIYVNENKKYISWDMTSLNKYIKYVDIYTCNSSGRDYYSLQDLGLTTKIYDLW